MLSRRQESSTVGIGYYGHEAEYHFRKFEEAEEGTTLADYQFVEARIIRNTSFSMLLEQFERNRALFLRPIGFALLQNQGGPTLNN